MDQQDARFLVAAMHFDLVGSDADSGILASLARDLFAHNDCSRPLRHLLHGDAHLDRALTDSYQLVLARDADRDELTARKESIRSGRNWISDLPLALLEQVAADADQSFESFLALVYDVTLGREVTVAEANHWAKRSRNRPRTSLVREIWSGPEASAHRIAEIYRSHLWRDPDPSGIATWQKALASGGDEPVRAGLVSSLEYLLLARARVSEPTPTIKASAIHAVARPD